MIPERLRALQEELDLATQDYHSSKDQLERAEVQFDRAQDRFAAARRRATETMTTLDWERWRAEHPTVRYAGVAIGDAIQDALRDYAYEQANLTVSARQPYNPGMPLDELTHRLEAGGYGFKGSARGREVNAALIALTRQPGGVRKLVDGYAIANAAQILHEVRQWQRS